MFWPKNLLADPNRFLKKRFGFGVLTHIQVQHGQVIEALGGLGIFWPKNFLPDADRFLVERFRLGGLAHFPVQRSSKLNSSSSDWDAGLRESRGQQLTAQAVFWPAVES